MELGLAGKAVLVTGEGLSAGKPSLVLLAAFGLEGGA